MKLRALILSCLVALTGGTAFFIAEEDDKTELQAHTRLLPDLSSQAENVMSVEVRNHQGVVFSAIRKQDTWMATHLGKEARFPVNTVALATMVRELSQATIVEPKTRNPALYDRLGVEDVTQNDAQSMLVTLKEQGRKWQIVIGQQASKGNGQYVRLADNQESILIDREIPLPLNTNDWLTDRLMPFKERDITRIAVGEAPGGFTLVRAQGKPDSWVLDSEPDLSAYIYPDVVTQWVFDLMRFDYDHVEPYQQNTWQLLDIEQQLSFELEDGTTVEGYLTVADESGERRWWIDAPDSPHWISDWVFVMKEFQARPLLTDPKDFIGEP